MVEAPREIEAVQVIEYPLTSFSSTPHNVSSISFLLGALWATGILFTLSHIPFNVSSVLGLYLSSWALFHLFEFLVTSMWNPQKLSVSSFLLNNGSAYHVAHFFGIIEHILERAYLPAQYYKYTHSPPLILLGLVLILAGQFLRSFAMITAAGNFSHIVAYKKLETHELVTNGIYSWSRHPSYAGFVWWALGTQVLLGNSIGFLAFSIVLYRFFSQRIAVEEQLLVKFFGEKYISYRTKVPTRILFI